MYEIWAETDNGDRMVLVRCADMDMAYNEMCAMAQEDEEGDYVVYWIEEVRVSRHIVSV